MQMMLLPKNFILYIQQFKEIDYMTFMLKNRNLLNGERILSLSILLFVSFQ